MSVGNKNQHVSLICFTRTGQGRINCCLIEKADSLAAVFAKGLMGMEVMIGWYTKQHWRYSFRSIDISVLQLLE